MRDGKQRFKLFAPPWRLAEVPLLQLVNLRHLRLRCVLKLNNRWPPASFRPYVETRCTSVCIYLVVAARSKAKAAPSMCTRYEKELEQVAGSLEVFPQEAHFSTVEKLRAPNPTTSPCSLLLLLSVHTSKHLD